MLCELNFEEKYFKRGEKCTVQCLMNPVPTVYPQKRLSKHLRYQFSKLFAVFPQKDPSHLNCQHFNNVI